MKEKKLVTKQHMVIIILAAFAGLGFFLFRIYFENGQIRTIEWISAVISFLVALGIFGATAWWGNKP